MAQTQTDLNGKKCEIPGCDHSQHEALFFHGRCHPSAPVTAVYYKLHGVIVIRCHRCQLVVAEVAVAS